MDYSFLISRLDIGIAAPSSYTTAISRVFFLEFMQLVNHIMAEQLNNNYFKNGRHTPLAIIVNGGTLTDESYTKLQQYVNDNEMHLCFKMDSLKYELQTSMIFEHNWVDILTFISPTAVKVESAAYMEVLKTVNFINWASKSTTGRMYLDDYGDIAYSLRFTYDWLDKYPETVIHEYESAIQYYEDLFTLLLEVAENKKTFEEARDFIEQMWNL